MTVSADEFLRRFLLHVLPKGPVRIRHFGFFANRRRETALTRCRELLGAATSAERSETTNLPRCPACSATMLVIVTVHQCSNSTFGLTGSSPFPRSAAMTVHKTSMAYDVDPPIARWLARGCKAVVCQQAVFPRRLDTTGSRPAGHCSIREQNVPLLQWSRLAPAMSRSSQPATLKMHR